MRDDEDDMAGGADDAPPFCQGSEGVGHMLEDVG